MKKSSIGLLEMQKKESLGKRQYSQSQSYSFVFNFIFIFMVLWLELRALYMLGKCPTTELYPQPLEHSNIFSTGLTYI